MFIGLELAHGGQNMASVAGMVYTVDEIHSMAGHCFYREQGMTVISQLSGELEIGILEYKKRSNSRAWPKHLFVYRSGVSEAEYTQGLFCVLLHSLAPFSVAS